MEGRGQILALTSSKGGVGKTHLAVGLSAAMAKRNARVLLIDVDLGNGIISDRLGFYPKYNLAHFFLKERALGDLIEETPVGFSLIGGDRGNLALANLNYQQRMKFLRSFIRVSRNFDFVLLDLASGINRQEIDFALDSLKDTTGTYQTDEKSEVKIEKLEKKRSELVAKAESTLEKAVRLDTLDLEAQLFLAQVYLEQEKLDEALRALEFLVEKDSTNCEALTQLAGVYAKKGIGDKAKETWQKAQDCLKEK